MRSWNSSDEAAEGGSVAALGRPYPLVYLIRSHLDLQEHLAAPTVTSFGIGAASDSGACTDLGGARAGNMVTNPTR